MKLNSSRCENHETKSQTFKIKIGTLSSQPTFPIVGDAWNCSLFFMKYGSRLSCCCKIRQICKYTSKFIVIIIHYNGHAGKDKSVFIGSLADHKLPPCPINSPPRLNDDRCDIISTVHQANINTAITCKNISLINIVCWCLKFLYSMKTPKFASLPDIREWSSIIFK